MEFAGKPTLASKESMVWNDGGEERAGGWGRSAERTGLWLGACSSTLDAVPGNPVLSGELPN